jgi:hypothetical protein
MTEIFRAYHENFDLGKGERTYGWTDCDVIHEYPLLKFRRGLKRLILKYNVTFWGIRAN